MDRQTDIEAIENVFIISMEMKKQKKNCKSRNKYVHTYIRIASFFPSIVRFQYGKETLNKKIYILKISNHINSYSQSDKN